ncbi:hypothetical protein Tco_0980245 [Tanacetum coccineum]
MPDTVNISNSEDTGSTHLPKIKPRPQWLKPILEEDRPESPEPDCPGKQVLRKTGEMGSIHHRFCKRIWQRRSSQNRYLYEEDPPGQVTIQSQFFFNKDLEYLVSGDKGKRSALSISKLKAAKYLDFGLEELVPTLWIESEREYDISVAYGISHWWFKRKEFYITRYSAPSDRGTVRSHMRVVSVVSLKTYERYSNMKHDMESYPELLKITWSVSLDPVE